MATNKLFQKTYFVIFSIFLAPLAQAQPQLLNLSQDAIMHFDHSRSEQLVIYLNGETAWLKANGTLQVGHRFSNLESECLETKDVYKKMQLVYPYLVGPGVVCRFDEVNASLAVVDRASLPENAFSLMYLGESLGQIYFLLNGVPWNSSGYMQLVQVEKKTGGMKLSEFIVNVPGFSGGMWNDGKNFYVTAWEGINRIYVLNVQDLVSLIPQAKRSEFLKLVKSQSDEFEGLSLTLFANDREFLLFNPGYESYKIQRADSSNFKMTLDSDCQVIGPQSGGWLTLCANRQVMIY